MKLIQWFAQSDIQQGLTYQPVTRDTWLVDAKGRHDFGDGLVLSTTLARSKAQYRELREMIKYNTDPRPGSTRVGYLPAFGYTYRLQYGRPRLVRIGILSGIIYPQRLATYMTPDVPYLLINRPAAWQRFEANRTAFIATNQIANNAADDFRDIETTKAAYAQALFRTDDFDVQAGVRYDATTVAVFTNQAPTVRGATAYAPVRRTTDYGYWLPSLLATYQLGDGMRVRAGVSKTIGRPDYSQYAARTSFGVGTDGSYDQPASAAAVAAGLPATRATSGLIQQPDYIANLTLFYGTGPVELRASYNRIGRALQSADGDTATRDLYQEPRQQVDVQARYAVGPGLELVGQVQNLTKSPFVVRQGVRRDYVNYFFPVGRTFWLGLTWKPGR